MSWSTSAALSYRSSADDRLYTVIVAAQQVTVGHGVSGEFNRESDLPLIALHRLHGELPSALMAIGISRNAALSWM